MTSNENGMRSVNWISGMLLTPEHFSAQDHYIEGAFGWLLRHAIPATGLLGGGVRLDAAERGLAAYDPRLEVSDDGRTVAVTVLQARGITGEARSATIRSASRQSPSTAATAAASPALLSFHGSDSSM